MNAPHMNFTQLQAFVALADLGSFTEAAEAVNLTQSAVSHALAALERELGSTLIERNRKGVGALTGVGQAILPQARALLANAAAIEQEAKAAQGRCEGRLRVGSVLALCPPLLAGTMTSFRAQYPGVEVVLFEGAAHEVDEWVHKSVVDIALVLHPSRALASTLIATDELCVLVPEGHRLHAQLAVSADDLRREGLIMGKADCSEQIMALAGLSPGDVKPLLRFQASDSTTIMAMVREGLGITLVPRMMFPGPLEGVALVPLAEPASVEIGLAVRAPELALSSARRFVQTAQAWAQQHMRGRPLLLAS
jgi:DNA-binding transcriptional LysR family regulator